MTKRQPKIYGAICNPGGRKIEITSEHSEWLDWAQRALYAASGKEALAKQSASIECPYCHWGFHPSVINQHIREKH